MGELFARVKALEDTDVITPYDPFVGALRIAQEGNEVGRIAYADVSLPPGTSGTEAQDMGRTIEGLIEELDLNSIEGLEVEVGGIWFAELRPPESEAIGLAFAIFVLIAVLGSVMAMGATVAAALVTVGIGATSIIVFSNFMTVPDFAPAIGLMIGLGVGIDYACSSSPATGTLWARATGASRPWWWHSTRQAGLSYSRERRSSCRCWECCSSGSPS